MKCMGNTDDPNPSCSFRSVEHTFGRSVVIQNLVLPVSCQADSCLHVPRPIRVCVCFIERWPADEHFPFPSFSSSRDRLSPQTFIFTAQKSEKAISDFPQKPEITFKLRAFKPDNSLINVLPVLIIRHRTSRCLVRVWMFYRPGSAQGSVNCVSCSYIGHMMFVSVSHVCSIQSKCFMFRQTLTPLTFLFLSILLCSKLLKKRTREWSLLLWHSFKVMSSMCTGSLQWLITCMYNS